MRAHEFITEGETGSLSPGVAAALPSTWVLPDLKNQDPYLQYRFGLALASARAKKAGNIPFTSASKFGENMVVSAFTPEDEETLMMALSLYGEHNAKELISTRPSEEADDIYTQSPVIPNTRKLNKS